MTKTPFNSIIAELSANRIKFLIDGSGDPLWEDRARNTRMIPTLYKQPVCLTFVSALFETPARIFLGIEVRW